MSLTALILAAGNGKRMNSDIPKVLHKIHGKSMIEWVISGLKDLHTDDICLILSPQIKPFSPLLDQYPKLNVCIQESANGTAGAVGVAQHFFEGVASVSYAQGYLYKGKKRKVDSVLICAGDIPAIDSQTLKNFVAFSRKQGTKLSILGMQVPDPTGYGRLVFSDDSSLSKIIEERDADESSKKIKICNSGIIYADVEFLFILLQQVEKKNSQLEYYLTDCVDLAVKNGERVSVYVTEKWEAFSGINDKKQLEAINQWFDREHLKRGR